MFAGRQTVPDYPGRLQNIRPDKRRRNCDAVFENRGELVKRIYRLTFDMMAIAMSLGLGACAGMSAQDKSTAIGAGAGAVGGAILTGGSAAGTVGGAVVGGVVGHEVGK